MPSALWLQPLASYKPCMVVHPWNPSFQEEEAEGPEVPGPLQQHSKFETSLSYMSLSQKKESKWWLYSSASQREGERVSVVLSIFQGPLCSQLSLLTVN